MKLLAHVAGMCLAAALAAADQVQITFQVQSDADTRSNGVFITGNQAVLGNWAPDAIPLSQVRPNLWARTISFERGSSLEYKFTLGAWEREALDGNGLALPNERITADQSKTAYVRVAQWKDDPPPTGGITGHVIRHADMTDGEIPPRDVLVWLPPGYDDDESRRYPVIYMHDGQQIFDPATATHRVDWGVDETATSLIAEGRMAPVIIVGAYCTKDRMKEYSEAPEGQAYMRFMTAYLKPFVDEHYRTMPDRGHTAVMGASMGGRISMLLLWQYPETYSMAGCLSSAFRGGAQEAVAALATPEQVKIYMDNGGVDLDAKLQEGNDQMLAFLRERGFESGKNLIWFRDPEATHNEEAWSRRVWMPLLYFFGTGEQDWIGQLPAPDENALPQ